MSLATSMQKVEDPETIEERIKWKKRKPWLIRKYIYPKGPPTIGKALSVAVVKRMGRKHGIQRISHRAMRKISQFARITLEVLIQDAQIYADSNGRRIIQVSDIKAALKRQEIVHYGHSNALGVAKMT